MSLRKKNLLRLAAAVVLFSIVFLCSAYFLTSKAGSREKNRVNKILCDTIYMQVMQKLYEPAIVSKMMSGDDFLLKFIKNEGDLETDSEIMKSYLIGLKTKFNFAQVCFISAKTHRYYRDDEMHKSLILREMPTIYGTICSTRTAESIQSIFTATKTVLSLQNFM